MKEKIQYYVNFFKTIETKLKQKPWFKKDKWLIQTQLFPSCEKPEALSFQIFKKHWFNEERKGIHFETARDLRLRKDNELMVTLHVFHYSKVPGTTLKRESISKPFIDRNEKLIRTWKGYKFRTGKYGTQFFSKTIKTSEKDLEEIVVNEFEKLCTTLGPEIDTVLSKVLSCT